MTFVFIILVSMIIILGSVIWRLLLTQENLEEYYEREIQTIEGKLIETKLKVEETVQRLVEVDIRGSFEADDEVGFAFKEIKHINEDLLQFIIDLDKQNKDAEKSESE